MELMPAVLVKERRYITSFDPATSLHIGTFVADNEADIANKIDRAAHCQISWQRATFRQRRRVIRSLMKWLVDNQDVAARVACRDTGKTCEFE
jgi:acyl-CoA reductase-like NAD-dependent aldehyde dehydrogenase